MARNPAQFALLSRILHWLMAAMLLAMLFIGVAMVASLGNYHKLVAIHRPLGIMILILAVIRVVNRRLTTLPPFPPTMSPRERKIASATERLLYTLMFALPLVGWGMLSAGHYPIVMFGAVHLPPILPAHPALYAVLRKTHTILAYVLFLTFLFHLSTVLFHTLIIRDRLLNRMALWPTRSSSAGRVFKLLQLMAFLGIIIFLAIVGLRLVLFAIKMINDREEALLFLAGAILFFVLAGLLSIVLWRNVRNQLLKAHDADSKK